MNAMALVEISVQILTASSAYSQEYDDKEEMEEDVPDKVMATFRDCIKGVCGNRPLDREVSREDMRLIFAGVLRKALEIVEGDSQ
jgi:hypothetical protein